MVEKKQIEQIKDLPWLKNLACSQNIHELILFSSHGYGKLLMHYHSF